MTSMLRKLVLSIAFGMTAILASSGVAMAGTGSTLVQNVWGSAGAFGNYANFDAHWTAWQYTSGTTQTWTILNLEMTALIKGGGSCEHPVVGPAYCTGWGFSGVATFSDWRGNTVLTVNLPAGSCYTHAASTNDRLLSVCRTGSFSFSVNKPSVVTLSKVTFSWSVGMQAARMFFFSNAWHYSRAITLQAT